MIHFRRLMVVYRCDSVTRNEDGTITLIVRDEPRVPEIPSPYFVEHALTVESIDRSMHEFNEVGDIGAIAYVDKL